MTRQESIFEKEGEPVAIQGNKPFLINDRDSVWFVSAGKVDLFSVDKKNGETEGQRSHVLRLKQGDIFFGFDTGAAMNGIDFLATGFTGSRLFRLRISLLKNLLEDYANYTEIMPLISNWITCISKAAGTEVLPKNFLPLSVEQEIELKDGETSHAVKKIVWVKTTKGKLLFMGNKNLPLPGEDVFFPMTGNTWLQAAEKSKLYAKDHETFLKNDIALWSGIDAFHRLLKDCFALERKESVRAENEQIKKKAESEGTVVKNALSTIMSVLDRKKASAKVSEAGENHLLAACVLVGDVIGVTITSPPSGSQNGASRETPLSDIAEASRVRMRKVALKEDWWERDNGPLLGFIIENEAKDKKRPVALLPLSPRKYELHDPAKKTKTVVTSEIASMLDYFGYIFYRPFPHTKLTFPKILKFALEGGSSTDLITIIAMGVAGGLIGMVTPLATATFFDTIIPQAERSQLIQLSLGLVVASFAGTAFSLVQSYATLRFETKVNHGMQAAVLDRLLSLPAHFFTKYTSGDLASRAMGINAIRQFMSQTVMSTLFSSFFTVFSFGLLFYYDMKLAIVATVLVLITIIYTLIIGYRNIVMKRDLARIQGKVMGIVLQLLGGVAKFRVAGSENRAFNYWAKIFVSQRSVTFRAAGIANILKTTDSVFSMFTTIVIYWWVANYSMKQGMSMGTFLAFNAAFGQFFSGLTSMSGIFLSVTGIIPIYERTKPILELLPEGGADKIYPGELTGEIEVSHIMFSYNEDTPPVLKDVSVQIHPGEFVAIVGPSGSGKSTLFRLLLGFETPSSGAIYYDGQDLAGLDIRSVRRQLSTVLQNSQLMPADIFTNIIGASDYTVEEAWEATRKAGLEEDIKQMPMGLHTVIPQGGSTMSGGQRQRLMIARALIKKPRIIFFDEATSALDNKTQAVVSKSLEELKTTRVVIAHRLSTIINADKIIVMENGEIVQSGSYTELIKEEGLFADLARRQIA